MDSLKTTDSVLFLDFLLDNGFNPYDGNNVLELIQSVPNSVSKNLKDCNQFLLSPQVNYSELEEFGIMGARGHLTITGEIVVPKSIQADKYFIRNAPKVPYIRHRYNYPDVADFDSVISYHGWDAIHFKLYQAILALYSSSIKNRYIGFVSSKNDKSLSKKIDIYKTILSFVNAQSSNEHVIVHDSVSKESKELYLIKKK